MANCETCDAPLVPREYIRKTEKQMGVSHGWHTPKRFCSRKCAGIAASKVGREIVRSKARGWALDKHGYVILTTGPRGRYQQPEHRAVMEKVLGRKLEKWETVHHKDGNRKNNHPSNLELWASRHPKGQRVTDVQPMTIPDFSTGLLSFGT